MADTENPTPRRRRWRSWADFPPIDWGALVAEREANRPWRYGDPVPLHIWQKAEKGRVKARARKKRLATDRWYAERSNRYRDLRAANERAVPPGEWVTIADVMARTGHGRKRAADVLWNMYKWGRAEKKENPAPSGPGTGLLFRRIVPETSSRNAGPGRSAAE